MQCSEGEGDILHTHTHVIFIITTYNASIDRFQKFKRFNVQVYEVLHWTTVVVMWDASHWC